jgi:hypothetical protein
MWIMLGIKGDNPVNSVENRGKTANISYLALRPCREKIKHIHISTENTTCLLIDLLPNIRYTNEAPLREQIPIPSTTLAVALGTIELMCYNRP